MWEGGSYATVRSKDTRALPFQSLPPIPLHVTVSVAFAVDVAVGVEVDVDVDVGEDACVDVDFAIVDIVLEVMLEEELLVCEAVCVDEPLDDAVAVSEIVLKLSDVHETSPLGHVPSACLFLAPGLFPSPKSVEG